MRLLRTSIGVFTLFLGGGLQADAASENKEVLLDHLQSVIAANFSQTDFSKYVEHLADRVLVGVISKDGQPVQYSDDKQAVEGVYDVLTSNKKNLFAARCRNTATDKGRIDDLVMCDLFVETEQDDKTRVEMFYGLKEGKIVRVVMGKVERAIPKAPMPAIKPVEKK